jgi:imidazolonepropionase-like amidohydrolase
MPILGFTGTQKGLTPAQRLSLRRVLRVGADAFHHGDCIGADAEAHAVAQELGLSIVIHPPLISTKRAFCQGAHYTYPPRPYMNRNHDIVDAAKWLVACPRREEVLHSGTWATVRYARKRGVPIMIVWPDGRVQHDGSNEFEAPALEEPAHVSHQ